MRPFAMTCLCVAALSACRPGDDIVVLPARPEHVEIGIDDRGSFVSFELPDGWRRIEEEPFHGFLYGKDRRTLRVVVVLKEDRFEAASDRAREETGSEVRNLEPWRGWPFVGVVVAYRGPPDAPLLDAFVRSFRVERR